MRNIESQKTQLHTLITEAARYIMRIHWETHYKIKISWAKNELGLGRRLSSVKCLLCKDEALSDSWHHINWCSVIPRATASGALRQVPGSCWLASLAKMISSRFSERPCLTQKTKKGREPWSKSLPSISSLHKHAYIYLSRYLGVHSYVHIQTHDTLKAGCGGAYL